MRRRDFIAALGSAAAAWPFVARAQQRIPRVGYLSPAPAEQEAEAFAAFKAGLSELGYVPGKTIEIEWRFTDGDAEKAARELIDLNVDVIVSSGGGVYAAHKLSRTVPIVTTATGDLVGQGLAESLAHPGGNITGMTIFQPEVGVKRIALLKQIKPAITTVGVVVQQGLPSVPSYLRAMDVLVKPLGVELVPIEVADPSDCERALSAGPGASIGGLVVLDFPQLIVGPGPAAVATAALRHGLPSAGPLSFPSNGGLLSYAIEYVPMFRRAAYFVDKILKGAKPGDIPIEQATKFITIVNLKTAKALGLDIPPTLLAAADEVIE
jgi:putative tryptophan/tyrosine transport system substrate-binding protein